VGDKEVVGMLCVAQCAATYVSLSTGGSKTVGVLIPFIFERYVLEFCSNVEEAVEL
jgi:predicted choloylglycine hydrolase